MTGGSAREEAPPQPPPPRPTVSVSLPAWPLPTGRPAGCCPRQRGRPERPGLLQAVEGDWLTPPPGPAVGLTPDLSCPPWPPGLPPAVTHLTQTHAHRKEAWLTRAGGARRGWEGWSPAARQCEGSEGSAWGSGGPGAPVSPAVRRDAAAWRLRFLGVVPGPPRGRDSGALLPHPACGGRGQEGAPSSPGESGGTRSRGLLCRPCSSGPLTLSPMGAGQLWSLGDSKKEGPGAGCADSSLGWACAHPPRGTRPPPSSQGAAGSLHAPGGPGGPPAPQQLRSCP